MAKQEIILELLNGVAAIPEMVKTPEGVVCGPLASADEYGDQIGEFMSGAGENPAGVFIFVPDGVDAGTVHVQNVFGEPGAYATSHLIVVGKGAKLNLLYELSSVDGVEVSDRRIAVAGEHADVRIEDIIPDSGTVKVENVVRQAADSRVETISVAPGTDAGSIVAYRTELRGGNALAVHAGLFFASGTEKVGYSVKVEHLVPDCNSDVLVKGIAGGSAECSFTGLVRVEQDAQHTEAYQQSRNLLLSDKAQILTSPQLIIYADDVRCSHGATVGQIDDDAVYYMRQRGLSEEQARGLQLAGFVNDILMRITNDVRRGRVAALAGEKLGNGFVM